jgi:hypothetical protein
LKSLGNRFRQLDNQIGELKMKTYDDLIFVCDDKGQHNRFELARFIREDPSSDASNWSNYSFTTERVRVAGHTLKPNNASYDDEGRLVLECKKCVRETRLNRAKLEKLVRGYVSNGQFEINISLLSF